MHPTMSQYAQLLDTLPNDPKTWLVTGVAGFIGSNLLEALLKLDQHVVGLDNFSTGHRHNLADVECNVSPGQWARFKFIEGDIRSLDSCRDACKGVDYVLHQAALGSVPRSLNDPITTNENNIDGFLNMLVAARDEGVRNFVYAGSSSTYGDHPALPKVEDVIGKPLSPYAITKYVNELYAEVFHKHYGMRCVGLRYFNVFGKRQDPNGAYAAVIPRWIKAMLDNSVVEVNGDGETSRDFCYVQNVIQANLLAATANEAATAGQVYNIAFGGQTSLNELFDLLRRLLKEEGRPYAQNAQYRPFRAGDIKHSNASIEKAARLIGYTPAYSALDGLRETVKWYTEKKS